MLTPTFVDDYALIATTLNKCIVGLVQGSSAVMRPAFAEKATVFSVENGKLSGGPVEGLFSIIDKSFEASPNARAAIVRVDTNDASGICYSDFIHLLRVDGEWIIVSKIYQTHA